MKGLRLLLFFLVSFPVFSLGGVRFPIEVLGKDQHIERVSLDLDDRPSRVTSIQLKAHNISFENKISIKINNDPWLDLNDTNVVYPKVEAAFWGMGGIQSVINFTVPVRKDLVLEKNIISFKFNDLDHKTVGYRILDIKVFNGSQNLKLQEASYEDPLLWKPISTNKADIIIGREIWNNATLRDNGKLLKAKCADCHFETGYDLKYFNFSDKSIIARSLFHEISQGDAEKIASYIRSLDVPYQRTARPWSGLFQPGPGMSVKPIESWMAGSGIVLDNDLKTLAFMFPYGLENAKIDFKDTVKAMNIPLVYQFPDLNAWLPTVHPIDAFPEIFTNGNPYLEIYSSIRKNLLIKTNAEGAEYFKRQASNWDKASASLPVRPDRDDSPEYKEFIVKYISLHHWRIMKSLELVQEFQLLGYGKEVFGGVQERLWPSYTGEVFRTADHMKNNIKRDIFHAQSAMWYQLQLALQDGNRTGAKIVPIDWGYLNGLNFSAWNNPIKMPTYGVAVLNVIKSGEVVENGRPITDKFGWDPYKARVDMLLGRYFGAQMSQIDIKIRRRMAEILLDAWINKANEYSKEEYEISRFFKDDGALEFNSLIKSQISQSITLGVSQEVINKYIDFGKRIFPFDSWEK